ncbi:unnamed protein product, partial [Strongylus vulgaris]
MVVQENSTAILMLCNFIEQVTELGVEISFILKAKKCAEYFPTEEGPPLVFEGNVSVQLKRQYPKNKKNGGQRGVAWAESTVNFQINNDLNFPFPFETKVKVMVRQLEVSVPDQPIHTCTHYHWMDWPDRGVPEADLAPVSLLARLKECTTPIIVHCSAGIGRTGSI